MTQEDKDLLLQDLCGRIPYGVKMNHIADTENNPITLVGVAKTMITLESSAGYGTSDIEDYIPYLFPISSMTEEQTKDFYSTIRPVVEDDLNEYSDYEESEKSRPVTMKSIKVDVVSVNWMLKNHFDINGLIPKNLAIDATNLNVY